MKCTSFLLASLFTILTSSTFGQKAVSPLEFQSLITQQASVQLIDVRTVSEYAGEHLKGSQNIDVRSGEFAKQIEKLDKNQPVFVYCLSGGRSASAARKIASMGFSEIYDMKGGIMAWKRAGLPLSERNNAAEPSGMDRTTYNKAVMADVPVLVNIYAPWCGPCKKMKPMLEELDQTARGKFKYVKLNADENDALLKSLDVAEIPTFFIYKNGSQTWKHVGLVEKGVLEKELGL
jgi:thioredoxin